MSCECELRQQPVTITPQQRNVHVTSFSKMACVKSGWCHETFLFSHVECNFFPFRLALSSIQYIHIQDWLLLALSWSSIVTTALHIKTHSFSTMCEEEEIRKKENERSKEEIGGGETRRWEKWRQCASAGICHIRSGDRTSERYSIASTVLGNC